MNSGWSLLRWPQNGNAMQYTQDFHVRMNEVSDTDILKATLL